MRCPARAGTYVSACQHGALIAVGQSMVLNLIAVASMKQRWQLEHNIHSRSAGQPRLCMDVIQGELLRTAGRH